MNALKETAMAYFIKLGEGGKWEDECLEKGVIKFGYRETPTDLCLHGEWEKVEAFWTDRRGNKSAASNDARQIRTFFEATSDDLFITFAGGYMWWCRPRGVPVVLTEEDGVRMRSTVDGWRNTSLGGELLLTSGLSGKLVKTGMYRGTICEVKDRDYLLRRINGEKSPLLAEAEVTEKVLVEQILAMIRLLTWEDFELMVELIFSRNGWQRQSQTGGTQRTIDLDLRLPATGERAFVQIKSQTNQAEFDAYAAEFSSSDRVFYVWHTGTVKGHPRANITLLGPENIGGLVLNAGLLAWLKDHVS